MSIKSKIEYDLIRYKLLKSLDKIEENLFKYEISINKQEKIDCGMNNVYDLCMEILSTNIRRISKEKTFVKAKHRKEIYIKMYLQVESLANRMSVSMRDYQLVLSSEIEEFKSVIYDTFNEFEDSEPRKNTRSFKDIVRELRGDGIGG